MKKAGRRCRPLPLREELYNRVLELRAEGSISGRPLMVCNTDLELLLKVRKWLRDFGIEATGRTQR